MKSRLSHLPIRLKLDPGQPGTKKLEAEYWGRLVCVRYRYDVEARRRYKTVELVVEAVLWWPGRRRLKNDAVVSLYVAPNELRLRDLIKQAGGKWNPSIRHWQLRYGQVKELKIEHRVIPEADAGARP